jgi:hypothetical protein
MNKRLFIGFTSLVLFINVNNYLWAEEKNDSIFSITPAISFSWYPYVEILEERSTKTEIDANNFGLSVLLGLNLFKKVNLNLALKIDDPSFKKMVDIAGYISAYNFMLKFDYHSFSGKVNWVGSYPNPIPDGFYQFNNNWASVSLLYRFDNIVHDKIPYIVWDLSDFPYVLAFGITYSNFSMPVEYQTLSGGGLLTPGFGQINGRLFGITLLLDTLARSMDISTDERSKLPLTFSNLNIDIWGYINLIYCAYLGNAELDNEAVAYMDNANTDNADGKIKQQFSIGTHNGISPAFFRTSIILGIQKIWDLKNNGRIGLGIGVEFLTESIYAHTSNIMVSYKSNSIGPVIRFSARW